MYCKKKIKIQNEKIVRLPYLQTFKLDKMTRCFYSAFYLWVIHAQVPMKNLYLKHIDMKMMGHQHLPGTLEISDTGQLYLQIFSTLGCTVRT
jgi:hypothetical protein